MTQAQRILNNRYELLAKIGDGGMAIVYKARDIILNRTVAIKVLRESYASDPAFLARFQREAQSAANLNHPFIVNVYDVGQEGNLYYIVMEYIEGNNLKDLINQEAPLSNQQAIELAAEICDAIGYAHSKGLIHRDIKPQNILLTPDGKVKVTDFGIAKGFGDQNLTQTGITLGTVHYFSPEQAKGLPVQPQSDIYSIGVVLYEMVTNRLPFDSDNPVALAVKHIEEAPPSPRRYNPAISPALEMIILKALSKEPAQRYPSAGAMAKALRNLESQSEMGTMAVQPTPVNRPPRTQYGNNEVYSQPITQPPYSQPNPNPTPRQLQGQGNYIPASGYNQPNMGQPQQVSRPNPLPPAGYNYDSQAYGRSGAVAPPYTDDFEEQRSSGPGWGAWIIGLLALVALIALIVVGIFILPPLLTPQPTAIPATTASATNTAAPVQVNVPNVVGKSEVEARQALSDANLQIGDEPQDFNSKVAPGSVISQDPAAGQKVNAQAKIKLVVSKGQEIVTLSDYKNTNPKAAQDAMTAAGFQVQVITQPDPVIQKDAVIKTDPEGGKDKQYPKGTIVKLYVSAGQATATAAPQPTATAVPATAVPQTTVPSALQPTATVVPPPTATPVATTLAVKVDVPDVFNKNQQEATQILEKAGFKVEVQPYTLADVEKYYPDPSSIAYYNNAPPGTVVGMNPGPTSRTKGKEQQPKGSTIVIGVKKA